MYSIIIYENTRHQPQLIPRYIRLPTRAEHTSSNSFEQGAVQPLLRFDSTTRGVVREIAGTLIQRRVFFSGEASAEQEPGQRQDL